MARLQWTHPGPAGSTLDTAKGGKVPRRDFQAAPADLLGRALALLCDGQAEGAESLMRSLAEAGDVDAMERLAAWHLWGPRLLGSGPWRRRLGRAWLERAARARAADEAA